MDLSTSSQITLAEYNDLCAQLACAKIVDGFPVLTTTVDKKIESASSVKKWITETIEKSPLDKLDARTRAVLLYTSAAINFRDSFAPTYIVRRELARKQMFDTLLAKFIAAGDASRASDLRILFTRGYLIMQDPSATLADIRESFGTKNGALAEHFHTAYTTQFVPYIKSLAVGALDPDEHHDFRDTGYREFVDLATSKKYRPPIELYTESNPLRPVSMKRAIASYIRQSSLTFDAHAAFPPSLAAEYAPDSIVLFGSILYKIVTGALPWGCPHADIESPLGAFGTPYDTQAVKKVCAANPTARVLVTPPNDLVIIKKLIAVLQDISNTCVWVLDAKSEFDAQTFAQLVGGTVTKSTAAAFVVTVGAQKKGSAADVEYRVSKYKYLRTLPAALAKSKLLTEMKGQIATAPQTYAQFSNAQEYPPIIKQYEEYKDMIKWSSHIGQRKLCNVLLQFWSYFAQQQSLAKKQKYNQLIVYVGSAPGTNIDILYKLGYTGKVLCIDPNFHIFAKTSSAKVCYVGINLDVIDEENYTSTRQIIKARYGDAITRIGWCDDQKLAVDYTATNNFDAFRNAHKDFTSQPRDVLAYIERGKHDIYIYQDYGTPQLFEQIFNARDLSQTHVIGFVSDLRTNSTSGSPGDLDIIRDFEMQYNMLQTMCESKCKNGVIAYSLKYRTIFCLVLRKCATKEEYDQWNKEFLSASSPATPPPKFNDEKFVKNCKSCLGEYYIYQQQTGINTCAEYKFIAIGSHKNIYFQSFQGPTSSETRLVGNPTTEGIKKYVISIGEYETLCRNYNLYRLYARTPQFREIVEKNHSTCGWCYCLDCAQELTIYTDIAERTNTTPVAIHNTITKLLHIGLVWDDPQSTFGANRLFAHGVINSLAEQAKPEVWLNINGALYTYKYVIANGRGRLEETEFDDLREVYSHDIQKHTFTLTTPAGTYVVKRTDPSARKKFEDLTRRI
jgi:hypothetical protein